MSKAERQTQVERLTATIEATPNVYVTDFAGLDVAKMTEFRRRRAPPGPGTWW
jgi:ribosomal protein L10